MSCSISGSATQSNKSCPRIPYQMVAVAQRLSKRGSPMAEFTQTLPNLTEASNNLYELIKARNLVVYRDAAMRKSGASDRG